MCTCTCRVLPTQLNIQLRLNSYLDEAFPHNHLRLLMLLSYMQSLQDLDSQMLGGCDGCLDKLLHA